MTELVPVNEPEDGDDRDLHVPADLVEMFEMIEWDAAVSGDGTA